MTVNHRISGSSLYLEELKLVSEQALIEGSGAIDLAREYTQFTARGRLRRLPGLVTVLLTRLLEFKGEGPVGSARWSLKGLAGFHPIINAPRKTTRTEEGGGERRRQGGEGFDRTPRQSASGRVIDHAGSAGSAGGWTNDASEEHLRRCAFRRSNTDDSPSQRIGVHFLLFRVPARCALNQSPVGCVWPSANFTR